MSSWGNIHLLSQNQNESKRCLSEARVPTLPQRHLRLSLVSVSGGKRVMATICLLVELESKKHSGSYIMDTGTQRFASFWRVTPAERTTDLASFSQSVGCFFVSPTVCVCVCAMVKPFHLRRLGIVIGPLHKEFRPASSGFLVRTP